MSTSTSPSQTPSTRRPSSDLAALIEGRDAKQNDHHEIKCRDLARRILANADAEPESRALAHLVLSESRHTVGVKARLTHAREANRIMEDAEREQDHNGKKQSDRQREYVGKQVQLTLENLHDVRREVAASVAPASSPAGLGEKRAEFERRRTEHGMEYE
ncbi:hypothetical protein MN608_10988 [Microdochium nivale]|nr:hypothetical protein MN608_10988 [Microdochium nivale]